MKYPALDVSGADTDLLLAFVDDFRPTAVEETDAGVSIYFATAADRDEASVALRAALPDSTLSSRAVDDEDWARRSQQNLTPVTVGRITVRPPWSDVQAGELGDAGHLNITILPSMGFGTGHHATTRLCLAALQACDVTGASVLDVGTGSGVLALAASALGAASSRGVDIDPDAVANAVENLPLNPTVRGVTFDVLDVSQAQLPTFDLVLANLTGAMLVRTASMLRSVVAPGGTLIVSGLQPHERDEVVAAFGAGSLSQSATESDWCCLTFSF